MNQSGLIIFQRIILGLVAFLFACPLILAGEAKADNEAAKAKIQEAYSRLPLSFIKNNGQVDERVKYYEKGAGHAVYFTEEAVYLELIKGKGSEKKSVVSSQNAAKGKQLSNKTSPHIASKLIKLSLINANKEQEIIAVDKQEGKVSYFIGNDSRKWRTNIPTYKGVLYKEAYKGIDIKYYGNNRQMEYDIIVKPGADPSKVRFSYEGIDGLRITGEGELEIALNSSSPIAGGDDGAKIIQKKPIIYQEVGGKRVEVEGRFVIASLGDSGKGGFSYGFQVDSYDKDYPLIIDPVLSYSTFIGGGYDDYGEGIAVDGGGNAYVTGGTYSFNFLATTGAYDTTHNGYYDVFVVKLNSTGTALLYATFIGGSYDDYAKGIAVDGGGNAYVTGGTYSFSFPTTTGAYDTTHNGSSDVFVLKLNSTGTALSYSTFIGGSYDEGGVSIAVDGGGNAYVTGDTSSLDFPATTGAYDTTHNGSSDVFVLKLNSTGTVLSYSTFIGGSYDDNGNGIAVDGDGNAYVIGDTWSSGFPTTGGYDTTYNGSLDVFVLKLNSTGTALSYSTFVGGSSDDIGFGIVVDGGGNAHVTGWTYSPNFPTTTGAYDRTHNGSSDVFVLKLNSTGTALSYSTFIGGSYYDFGAGIALDGVGNAYVSGDTWSTDFPTTTDAYSRVNKGLSDVFVLKLNSTGTVLSYSTLIGGNSHDYGYSIVVDGLGSAYISSHTRSTDFPTTTGAYDRTHNGYYDVFVLKLDFGPVDRYPLTVSKTGTGTGTVTSSPVGINCGADCTEPYNPETVVALTAISDIDSVFTVWSGACTGSGACIVTMNEAKSVTATFDLTLPPPPSGGVIPKTNWTLKYADSQETVLWDGAAVNAFDNNSATIWHTKWNGGADPLPHEIQIDMGGVYDINGFRYLPRQDGWSHGMVGQYEFYVSMDGVNWGSPVATGTFANSAAEKEVSFTQKTGRFIRLRAITEVNGNPWTSMAELTALGALSSGNLPPNSTIDSPSNDITINVGDTVTFAGTGSDSDNNLPLTYRWNFGAGSGIADSTLEDPGVKQFNVAGTYTVTFTVTDSLGASDPTPATRVITVLNPSGGVIPKTNWTLKYADSQEAVLWDGAAVNAFDNNSATIWHTKWNGGADPLPHEIQIDMGGFYDVNGFRYLPRQDGWSHGMVGQYEFYVSMDGVNWGSPVATGTFANSAAEKEVSFTQKTGRFIRLRAITEVNGNPWTSMAEITVLGSSF